MPIRFVAACAVLEGHCTVEEANDLAQWLIAKPARKVDLEACTGLHAAVLQCLMALGPEVLAGPRDAELARWLAPVLALPDPAAARPSRKPASPRRRAARPLPAPARRAQGEPG